MTSFVTGIRRAMKMRCEAAAKLPGGSPGRGCGRAVEVRVGKVRNKMDIQGTSNGEVEASL
jgi:hypothetical protein